MLRPYQTRPAPLSAGSRHQFLDRIGGARGSRRQPFRALGGDQYVVFDSHAQLFRLDVDPRLEGDHHPRLERPAYSDVMHIQPDGVTEAVIEELAIIAGAVAAEIPGVVAHEFPRDAVQLAHRDPRPQGIKGRLLRPKHQIVNRLLARREPAVDREGPPDVGGVLPPLVRGVDDDEVALLGLPAVDVVMERGGVRPAADDRRVAYAVRAVAPESLFQHRLELLLVHPRPR